MKKINENSHLDAIEWFIKNTDPKDAQKQAESNWMWRLERSDLTCLIPIEDYSDLNDMAENPMSYVEGNNSLWEWLMDCCLVDWFRVFKSLVDAGVLSEEQFKARYEECMDAVKPNNELVARWVKKSAKHELYEIELSLD